MYHKLLVYLLNDIGNYLGLCIAHTLQWTAVVFRSCAPKSISDLVRVKNLGLGDATLLNEGSKYQCNGVLGLYIYTHISIHLYIYISIYTYIGKHVFF